MCNKDFFSIMQVIVADNFFSGSKDNLKKWIGHPNFELIRHGLSGRLLLVLLLFYWTSHEPLGTKFPCWR
jgi:hypothetical protein